MQKIWERDRLLPAIELLNVGFPGSNSSHALRDLDRNLELFEPDLLLIEIGSNDRWTMLVPADSGRREGIVARLQRWSRLYRLLYMATRTPDQQPVVSIDVATLERGRGELEYLGQSFELGFDRGTGATAETQQLGKRLRQILAKANARGVRSVLLNYASDREFYRWANRNIALVASSTGTPLIDLQPVFRDASVCPAEPCPRWIFPPEHPAHAHPTAEGYELVAKAVVGKLHELLKSTRSAGN